MIGKRDKFWGGFEKQSALKLRWRRVADCSRGGIWQPEMHDHQQWTAVYVGSLAARMTTTGYGDALDVVGKIPWHQAVQASVVSTANLKLMCV